jgi:dTDP-4-amino-4,6-dideoxygalactose transaminase
MRKIPALRLSYSKEEKNDITKGVNEILNSGFLTMGEKVTQFERLFAEFVGVKYAVAVNSGTSALEIPLRALNVEGKSIIIPTNTFMATPLAALHAGAKVIFADVSRESLSIDPKEIEKKIIDGTIGVIIVHIGGIISPEWNKIKKICESNGLFILEDAAHAHGATLDGQMAGSLGTAGSFSFYPTKIVNTAEGGMITTDDEDIYKLSLILREHGKTNPNFDIHSELGYNWRFSEFHALLGLQQMKKLPWMLFERRRLASIYDELIKEVHDVTAIELSDNIESSYYKYLLFLNTLYDSTVVKNKMRDQFGITLPSEVYANPCHNQLVFKRYPELVLNKTDEHFPGSKYVSDRQICLPLYPGLTDDELMYVVDSLKSVLESLN